MASCTARRAALPRTASSDGPNVFARPAVCRGKQIVSAPGQAASPGQRISVRPCAVPDAGGAEDYQRVAASLNQLLERAKASITGRQLRSLVQQKWGRSYDVRLCKMGKNMYLQVMWKFLEQQSFPLTEDEYMQQLDAVAEYLTEWGVVDTVRSGIQRAPKPPGYTGGGNARCVSIPLNVDLGGTRSAEWM